MWSQIKDKLTSRKFWLALTGLILVVANDPASLNLSAQAQDALAASPVVYIIAQSVIEIIRELKGNNAK